MFYVYIISNRRNGTLYTGHTDDLMNRVWEHKNGHGSAFTKKWKCHRLVWFECHETRESAFIRERRMKEWNRDWKIARIEAHNPWWDDLSEGMTESLLYDPNRLFPKPLPGDGPRPSAG